MPMRTLFSLLALVGCLVLPAASRAAADDAERVELRARFRFSGVFWPTHVDTNGDGFGAEVATDEIKGSLKASTPGHGRRFRIDLVRQSKMVEYAFASPDYACFRVNEDDFSIEEGAYRGPLFELLDPIRMEAVASDPLLTPHRAETWTNFYQLETGELLFARLDELQICIENVPEHVAPWPLCHIRWRETIIGGTGRFRQASGGVSLAAIAPTATANAPAFDRNGRLNFVFPAQGPFLFGPSYGAGDMHVEIPRGLGGQNPRRPE